MRLAPGLAWETRRTFAQDEFDRFAALSGDDNPIHVDPEFSARTHFGRTVAHGMLLYTALCGALQAWLPGARQLEQELMFPNPTYAGEEVTIRLAVAELPGPDRAWLDTLLLGPDGSPGLQGRTLVALAGLAGLAGLARLAASGGREA